MEFNAKRMEKKLQKKIHEGISCQMKGKSLWLTGQVSQYNQIIEAGYMAAKGPFREVVNDLTLFFEKNYQNSSKKQVSEGTLGNCNHKSVMTAPELAQFSKQRWEALPDSIKDQPAIKCDCLIIGGGITGAAIARALSRWDLKTIVVEKEYDVAIHASSRNDGMVHPGIAAKFNSLKCRMNIRGNQLYHQVSEELEVPIRWCGSSILFRSHWSKVLYPYFWTKAKWIKMPGLSYMNERQVYEKEPSLSPGVKWGVFCASAGVTSPYKMTVAFMENAIHNGVDLMLSTEVLGMTLSEYDIHEVLTTQGRIQPQVIINAAGVYADVIAEMADDRYYSIHPRKGEVVLLDKKKSSQVVGILGFVGDRSSKNTKGGGLIRTYEGNILVGPNAIETPEREDYSTCRESLSEMLEMKLPQVEGLQSTDAITYFTGVRAATYSEDFIIEASEKVENLIHVGGIQSPGFASAPAIAEETVKLVEHYFKDRVHNPKLIEPNRSFQPKRTAIPDLANMPIDERRRFIEENPSYGDIICRCEEISRGEITAALQGPIPIQSVDAVKRRVRAGMGRCQGGFCLPLVMEIIHDIKGIPMASITKKEMGSEIAVHSTKQGV